MFPRSSLSRLYHSPVRRRHVTTDVSAGKSVSPQGRAYTVRVLRVAQVEGMSAFGGSGVRGGAGRDPGGGLPVHERRRDAGREAGAWAGGRRQRARGGRHGTAGDHDPDSRRTRGRACRRGCGRGRGDRGRGHPRGALPAGDAGDVRGRGVGLRLQRPQGARGRDPVPAGEGGLSVVHGLGQGRYRGRGDHRPRRAVLPDL